MIHFILQKFLDKFVRSYLESLCHVLKDSQIHFYEDTNIQELLSNNAVCIFVQTGPYFKHPNALVMNIEQLSKQCLSSCQQLNAHLGNYNLLCDYSMGNIRILNNLTDISKPVYYLPYQYNPSEIYNFEKTKGLVFVGDYYSARRKSIIENIPNINIITDKYGKELDADLFRHKILVNVHHSADYNIHEQIRTTRCVFNKMIVISETSLDDDTLPLRKHMIIVEYDKIIETVHDVLANYDMYYTRLFDNEDFEKVKETLASTLQESCIQINHIHG